LACAATFAATSHVLYNAPSSTNVIVGVDGLLQGKARHNGHRSSVTKYVQNYVSEQVFDIFT